MVVLAGLAATALLLSGYREAEAAADGCLALSAREPAGATRRRRQPDTRTEVVFRSGTARSVTSIPGIDQTGQRRVNLHPLARHKANAGDAFKLMLGDWGVDLISQAIGQRKVVADAPLVLQVTVFRKHRQ